MAMNLGKLAATVTLDIDPFKRNATALNSVIRSTGSAIKAQQSALSGYGNKLNGMKSIYGNMEKQMSNYEAKLKAQKATYQDLARQTATTSQEQEKLITRQSNAANAYNRTSAQMEALKAEMYNMNKQIQLQSSHWHSAGTKMQNFGSGMQTVGQKAQSVGGALTRGVTTPLVAIGTAAVKVAVDFDHQMSRVKAISGATGGQFDKMKSQAIDLGAKTQFSAREAAAGMENLASAGLKPQQIMKAMPGVLDLAAVSGGNVAESADAAASALNAFGLSANKSGHLADVYAKAAADTNAETADMAEAMKYAAPVAHSLGISLEDTAASIGIMSNAGIKGSQAGTTLRGAMSRLAKPTKVMQSTMKELGVSFFDSQGQMKPMGTIIGELSGSMKGYDKKTKAAMLTTLFGKEALSGMMALVDAGPNKFNKLSKGLENSDGSAKKMAKTMNDDAKGSIESMMGSLESAGIKIGEALAPSIIDVTKDVSKMVDAFTNLDPKTQNMIVKWGLLAAAGGPVISTFGKLSSGIGSTVKVLGGTTQGIGRMIVATKNGGTALQVLKSGFSQASFDAIKFGKSTTTVGTGLASLGGKFAGLGASASGMGTATEAAAGSIGLLNPAVLATVGVIGAGVVAWEAFGKKAYESSQKTGRWGTDVSNTADKALTDFKGTSDGIVNALNDMDTGAKTSTKSMSKSFDTELDKIQKSAEEHMNKTKQALKGLPKDVQDAALDAAKKESKTLDDINKDAQQHGKQAQQILKTQHGSVNKLNDDQRQMLKNHQDAISRDAIKAAGITGTKQKTILAALNNDINGMTKKQRSQALLDLKEADRQEINQHTKQAKKLKKQHDDGLLSDKAYAAAKKQLDADETAEHNRNSAAYIRTAKKNGETTQQIKNEMLQAGLSYKNGMAQIRKEDELTRNSSSLTVSTVGKMGKGVKKAAETWNSTVFDPKTGKLKTNAQAEVTKAVKSKNKWNQIKLLEKKGKLSSNAKSMVANSLLESGKWNSMSWKERKAWIRTNAGEEVAKALVESGKWNSLTLAQKQAIINSKGKKELAENIVKLGIWNSLPTKVKKTIAQDAGAHKVLTDAGIDVDKWNVKKPVKKHLTADETSVKNASNKSQSDVDKHNSKKVSKKQFTGAAGGITTAANQSVQAQEKHNRKNVNKKSFVGSSLSVQNAARAGWSHIDTFNGRNPHRKTFSASDQASGPARSANSAVDSFSRRRGHTVKLVTQHISNFISNFISHYSKRAKGDPNFSGGNVMVNDQKGGTYEELVTLPNGQSFIPQGRNFIFKAPRGTRITKASETAKLFKRYAGGTMQGNKAVETILSARPAIEKMSQATQVRMGDGNTVQVSNDNSDVVDVLHEQMDVQKQQLSLMSRMLNVVTDPNVTQSSREAIRNMSQQFNSFDNQRARGAL